MLLLVHKSITFSAIFFSTYHCLHPFWKGTRTQLNASPVTLLLHFSDSPSPLSHGITRSLPRTSYHFRFDPRFSLPLQPTSTIFAIIPFFSPINMGTLSSDRILNASLALSFRLPVIHGSQPSLSVLDILNPPESHFCLFPTQVRSLKQCRQNWVWNY